MIESVTTAGKDTVDDELLSVTKKTRMRDDVGLMTIKKLRSKCDVFMFQQTRDPNNCSLINTTRVLDYYSSTRVEIIDFMLINTL